MSAGQALLSGGSKVLATGRLIVGTGNGGYGYRLYAPAFGSYTRVSGSSISELTFNYNINPKNFLTLVDAVLPYTEEGAFVRVTVGGVSALFECMDFYDAAPVGTVADVLQLSTRVGQTLDVMVTT